MVSNEVPRIQIGKRNELEIYKEHTRMVSKFKHKNKLCLVLYLGTHYCAYVETIFKGKPYEFFESGVDCHCGVTHAGNLSSSQLDELDIDHFKYYVGCDYSHSGDFTDYSILIPDWNERFPHNKRDHKWTDDEVIADTKKFAESLIEFERDRIFELL